MTQGKVKSVVRVECVAVVWYPQGIVCAPMSITVEQMLQVDERDSDAVKIAKIEAFKLMEIQRIRAEFEPQRLLAQAELTRAEFEPQRLLEERLLLEAKNKHVEDMSFSGECYKIW